MGGRRSAQEAGAGARLDGARQGVNAFSARAADLDAALVGLEDGAREGGAAPDAGTLEHLNDALVQVERAFLDLKGLPDRPWFRHILYAPGLTTGYASWPFPGVVQALKDRDPKALEEQIRNVGERLAAGTARLEAARAIAERR
jgi:N-acetylated-alpha-linked acidic dipeptidase